jgi:signal transduction histidine kinase
MLPFFITACIGLAATVVLLGICYARQRSRSREEADAMRAEHAEALCALELERSAMLNALSDAFFLVDSNGCIRFANAPASDLFSGREILDQPIDEVFLEKRLRKPIRKAIKRNKRVTKEVTLSQQASPRGSEDRPGDTVWMVDAGPIESDNSTNLTRVIIRDATLEHQTEQIRKDFVANASHELRTPLAIINGYLENLIEDDVVADLETARRFLKIMRKHGERIARIVEDMLIISRLESGEAGSINVVPFLLDACVQDVLERLESVIVAQGAKVKLTTNEPELVLAGDRFYWTQVIFNLVENALKQNPKSPLQVEIGWERNSDGELQIWVTDNGVGIPSGDLPFIFRRFYRVVKHHSQVEIKGTGLGLSIVKRAVEAHGGEIEVTSAAGQETRFEILLPPEAFATSESAAQVKAG